jgi:hypothetical protein
MTNSTRQVTASSPLIIQSPRIGFLNLLGASGRTILVEDKTALGPLFARLEESETDPPVCDVLMIYADVQADGRLASRFCRWTAENDPKVDGRDRDYCLGK